MAAAAAPTDILTQSDGIRRVITAGFAARNADANVKAPSAAFLKVVPQCI